MTVEMKVDFRKHSPALTPLTISNSLVTRVDSFRFLGVIISQDLKKTQQRMYFLWQLRKHGLP